MTKTVLMTLVMLVALGGLLLVTAYADDSLYSTSPLQAAQQALGNLHDSLLNNGGASTADQQKLMVPGDTAAMEDRNTLLLLQFISLLNLNLSSASSFSRNSDRAEVLVTPQPLRLIMKQENGQWTLDLEATRAALPRTTRQALQGLNLWQSGQVFGEYGQDTVGQVDDNNFEQRVTRAPGWVLVDFGAEWCEWCKRLAPELETLAHQYAGRVRFLSMDTDQSPRTAQAYNVRGLPTMILFQNGLAGPQQEGFLEAAPLRDWLEAGLRGQAPTGDRWTPLPNR